MDQPLASDQERSSYAPNQGVNLGALDVVHLPHGILDVVLVGQPIEGVDNIHPDDARVAARVADHSLNVHETIVGQGIGHGNGTKIINVEPQVCVDDELHLVRNSRHSNDKKAKGDRNSYHLGRKIN
jgi:hypothetical protein